MANPYAKVTDDTDSSHDPNVTLADRVGPVLAGSPTPDQTVQAQVPQQLPPQYASPYPAVAMTSPQPAVGVALNPYSNYAGTFVQPPPAPVVLRQSDGTVVLMQQPQIAMAQPVQPMGVMAMPVRQEFGVWTDGICDCFTDITTCCLAFFVTPYRWALSTSRARLGEFWRLLLCFGVPWVTLIALYIVFQTQPAPQSDRDSDTDTDSDVDGGNRGDGGNAGPLFMIANILSVVVTILGCTFRSRIREKYQIPGSACEDCLLHCCCRPCAVAQEARFIDQREGVLGPWPVPVNNNPNANNVGINRV